MLDKNDTKHKLQKINIDNIRYLLYIKKAIILTFESQVPLVSDK